MSTAAETAQTLIDSLPVFTQSPKGSFIRTRENLAAFITVDLDTKRLDDLANKGLLWLAGRVNNIRPLHRQKGLGRRMLVTEQLDLHLLWKDDILFIKPLPLYLLNPDFVQKHLRPHEGWTRAANGFLWSYARLIMTKRDFIIAKEEDIVPEPLEWADWQRLLDGQLGGLLEKHQAGRLLCTPRFCFGELRLSRVDLIYRLHPAYALKYFTRGYHTMSRTYQSFLRRNFAWLLVVFAYVTIILTAMQVGLGAQQSWTHEAFNNACFVFAIFSIMLPVITIVGAILMSIVLAVYHIISTRRHMHEWHKDQVDEEACMQAKSG